MKRKIFLLASCTILFGACSFLDVVPDDVATIEHAFSDRERAEQYLYTTYSYLPHSWDNRNPGYMGDEWWSNPAATLQRPAAFEIMYNGTNVSNPILDYWSGDGYVAQSKTLWKGIRDCNIFLDHIGAANRMDSFEKEIWAAEVKFLKAYYHFLLFRMYGPIPIMDDDLPVSTSPEGAAVYREPIDKVIEYIVGLIDEAIPNLPLTVADQSSLGRITRPIALGIKAKVLATAASPLFNGNTSYQGLVDNRGIALFNTEFVPERWTLAADAAKAAIEAAHSAGHRLYTIEDLPLTRYASDSTKFVLLSNQIVADRWNPEIIWGAPTVGDHARLRALFSIAPLANIHRMRITVLKAPTMKMAEMFYTDNGVPIDEDIDFDFADRQSVVEVPEASRYYLQPGKMTAKLHLNREARFYGSMGMDAGWWFGFGREIDTEQWPINAKLGETSGREDVRKPSTTGYWTKKHHSFRDSWSGDNLVPFQWGEPVLRLADLYLLYAEALNEALDAPNEEVLRYVDMVRARTGLKGVEDSWKNHSRNPDKYQSKAGMREIIHQERGIELAFEMHRFWDVIRWGRAVEELSGAVEGWNVEGSTPEEFYQKRVLNQGTPPFTHRSIFWPIKHSELTKNTNLVQNPGW